MYDFDFIRIENRLKEKYLECIKESLDIYHEKIHKNNPIELNTKIAIINSLYKSTLPINLIYPILQMSKNPVPHPTILSVAKKIQKKINQNQINQNQTKKRTSNQRNRPPKKNGNRYDDPRKASLLFE